MRPDDVAPEAWRVYVGIIRAMSPSDRMYRAMELSDLVRYASEAGIRRAYPDADEREVFLRSAQRRLGPELFHGAYGRSLPPDEPRIRG